MRIPHSLLLILAFPLTGNATCFEAAAARYQVPPALLRAVAQVESSGNPGAINRYPDGRYDLGLMQINSWWFPKLQQYGITPQALLNPCTNAMVGAWILAQNIQSMGYTWEAIGAYNAQSTEKRTLYAHKIAKSLREGGVR